MNCKNQLIYNFCMNRECFPTNFKVFGTCRYFLMQTQKFIDEHSHGDLTVKVLPLEHFVLYNIVLLMHIHV